MRVTPNIRDTVDTWSKITEFFNALFQRIKQFYALLGSFVHGPYAHHILVLLFLLEALFFIPADPLLLIYCIERRDRAFTYATIATVASVFGGIVSYYLGFYLSYAIGPTIFSAPIISWILPYDRFVCLTEQFACHGWMAVLATGFTPIPYKAITLASGFCHLPFIPFLIAAFIVRGVRFYAVAGGTQLFEYFKIRKDTVILFVMTAIILFFIIRFMLSWFFSSICTLPVLD